MVEGGEKKSETQLETADVWLLRAQELVPEALESARSVKGFPGRWKIIISKLERVPSQLSYLSSHPCFSKNSLCMEQLQAVVNALAETVELAEHCIQEKYIGKLQTQSDICKVELEPARLWSLGKDWGARGGHHSIAGVPIW